MDGTAVRVVGFFRAQRPCDAANSVCSQIDKATSKQTLSLTALLSPPLGEVGRGSGRVGVVGSTTRPTRPLPDPLRVGGEADIVRTSAVLNPGLLGNQKRQRLRSEVTQWL